MTLREQALATYNEHKALAAQQAEEEHRKLLAHRHEAILHALVNIGIGVVAPARITWIEDVPEYTEDGITFRLATTTVLTGMRAFMTCPDCGEETTAYVTSLTDLGGFLSEPCLCATVPEPTLSAWRKYNKAKE